MLKENRVNVYACANKVATEPLCYIFVSSDRPLTPSRFERRDIPVLSGWITLKLATDIRHVGFTVRGQRSRKKGKDSQKSHKVVIFRLFGEKPVMY